MTEAATPEEVSPKQNTDGRSVPRRPKPKPAAKASRLVAAGAAVGASLTLVGAMAGAATGSSAQPEPASTVQRVVVPQQTVSEPIVIVLPQQQSGQTPAAASQPIVRQAVVPAMPEPAPAPAPAAAPQPVAESGGS